MPASPSPDRRELDARALTALRTLVAALALANAFYTRKWAGLAPPESLADFRARYPFTDKKELVADQLAAPPFGTNLTEPLERYTRFHQTSGTTGVPLRWLDTPESWAWVVENWTRVFRASGATAGDRVFFAFSFGPFLGFWTAFQAAERLGCLCLPGGGMSTDGRLRAILDNGATVLCCTPTYALHLGEAARAAGLDLAAGAVRLIIAAGEPGAGLRAVRARIESLWPGARVRDHHGMTETGPVTYECPERPGVLHVLEPEYIAEVVDPATGAPAPPGTEGELVLTNLGRTASPLLRYRTGDLVTADPPGPCACGSWEMALPGGIRGRTDDMVVVRGVNLYPSAVDEVVRRFPEVSEYRVEIRARGALAEVALEVEAAGEPAAVCRAVEAALRGAFNLRIPVRPAPPGSLPRFELKARRWRFLDPEGHEGEPEG